jgi:hypothetical protein
MQLFVDCVRGALGPVACMKAGQARKGGREEAGEPSGTLRYLKLDG